MTTTREFCYRLASAAAEARRLPGDTRIRVIPIEPAVEPETTTTLAALLGAAGADYAACARVAADRPFRPQVDPEAAYLLAVAEALEAAIRAAPAEARLPVPIGPLQTRAGLHPLLALGLGAGLGVGVAWIAWGT